jgi:hypothetical protein
MITLKIVLYLYIIFSFDIIYYLVMTDASLILYYSQVCVYSDRILQILNSNPAIREKIKVACVDSFYKKTGKFPNGIRGTPSIFEESNQRVKVYEGKTAMELVKQLATSRAAAMAIEAERNGSMKPPSGGSRPQNGMNPGYGPSPGGYGPSPGGYGPSPGGYDPRPPTHTNNSNDFEVEKDELADKRSSTSGVDLKTAFGQGAEWTRKLEGFDTQDADMNNPMKFDGVNPFADERFSGKKTSNADVLEKLKEMEQSSPYNKFQKQPEQTTGTGEAKSPYAAANSSGGGEKKRDPFTAANSK